MANIDGMKYLSQLRAELGRELEQARTILRQAQNAVKQLENEFAAVDVLWRREHARGQIPLPTELSAPPLTGMPLKQAAIVILRQRGPMDVQALVKALREAGRLPEGKGARSVHAALITARGQAEKRSGLWHAVAQKEPPTVKTNA